MDYVLRHWGFAHYAPVVFDACVDEKARRSSCRWLLENTESFDQWVLAVWILDRFPNDYTHLTLVAIACLARKYHSIEHRAWLNRNSVILGGMDRSCASVSDVMKMEKRIMNRVGWSLPSFQMTACMQSIARSYFKGCQMSKSIRVLKRCVVSWFMLHPVRSCAWACIVPSFAAISILSVDDTPWLRGLASMKVSESPLWLPIGFFIELARSLIVRVRSDDNSYCCTTC